MKAHNLFYFCKVKNQVVAVSIRVDNVLGYLVGYVDNVRKVDCDRNYIATRQQAGEEDYKQLFEQLKRKGLNPIAVSRKVWMAFTRPKDIKRMVQNERNRSL